MASWMGVTGSPETSPGRAERGFSMQGFKTRQRKKVMEQMAPGDNLVYYLTGVQAFGATAVIESEGFEDHEVIWQSKPGEDYPWRVKIAPTWCSTRRVGAVRRGRPGLVYVQKWPAEHWKLAFQGNLHLIPDDDFATLRDAIAAARQG